MPALYSATGHSAGEQCSSTYEGRHLTLEESYLVHPTHADGFVDGGDPVVVGRIVGVAFVDAAADTDFIAIDTEGIWFLNAVANDDSGGSAINEGDEIFINRTTGVLSKITNIATQQPFGYALGDIASGTTDLVAIKVHHDPTVDAQKALFNTVPTTEYGKSMRATLADPGQSEGLSDYQEGHIPGVTAGHVYNHGSWVNVDNGATLTAGHIITPYEGGVYCGEAQAAARVVFAGGFHAILGGNPASLHAWRLNTNRDITALIAFANPGSAGYAVGTAGTGVVGTMPLADIVGHGVRYIDLHAAVA